MADRQQKVDAGKKKFLKLRTKKRLSTTITINNATSIVESSPATIAATPAYRELLESYQVSGSAGTSRSNTPVPSIAPASQPANPESVPKTPSHENAVPPNVLSAIIPSEKHAEQTQHATEPNSTIPSSALDLYQNSEIPSYVDTSALDITSATIAATSVRQSDPNSVQNKTADVFSESILAEPKLERILPLISEIEPLESFQPKEKTFAFLEDLKQSSVSPMYHQEPDSEIAAIVKKSTFPASDVTRQSSVLDMYHEESVLSKNSSLATDPARQSIVLDMFQEQANIVKAAIPEQAIPATDMDRRSSVLDIYDEKPNIEKTAIPQKLTFGTDPFQHSSVLDVQPNLKKAAIPQQATLATALNRQSSVLDMYLENPNIEKAAIPQNSTDSIGRSSVLDVQIEKPNLEKAAVPQQTPFATDMDRQSSVVDMYHEKPSIEKAAIPRKSTLGTDPIRQSSVLDVQLNLEKAAIAQQATLATDLNRQSSVMDMYHENPNIEKAAIPQNSSDSNRRSSVLDVQYEKPKLEKAAIPQQTNFPTDPAGRPIGLDMHHEKFNIEKDPIPQQATLSTDLNRQSSVLDKYHEKPNFEKAAIRRQSTFGTDAIRPSSVLDVQPILQKAEIPQQAALAADLNRQSSVLQMYHEMESNIEKAVIPQKSTFGTDPIRQSGVLDAHLENAEIPQKSTFGTDPSRQSSVLDMYQEKHREKDTTIPTTAHQKTSKHLENRLPFLNADITNRSPPSPKDISRSTTAQSTPTRHLFSSIFKQSRSDLMDESQNRSLSEENLLASYYCLPTPSKMEIQTSGQTKIAADTDRSGQIIDDKEKQTIPKHADSDPIKSNAGSPANGVEKRMRKGTDGMDKVQQKRSNDLEKSLASALMAFRKEKTDREMLERVVGENVTAMNESLDRFMAEKESLQIESISLKRKLGEAMNRLENFEKTIHETDRHGIAQGPSERTLERQEGVRTRIRSVGTVIQKEDRSTFQGENVVRLQSGFGPSIEQDPTSDSLLQSTTSREPSREECPECGSLRNELSTKNVHVVDLETGRILLERKLDVLTNEKEELRIQNAAKFRFLSNRIQVLESEKFAVAGAVPASVVTEGDEDVKTLRKRIDEISEEWKRECGAYESRIMELDLQVSRLIKSNEILDRDCFQATNRGKLRLKEIERLIQVQRERDEQHAKEKEEYERRLSVLERKSPGRRSSVCGSIPDESTPEDVSSSTTVQTSNHGEYMKTSRSHLVKLILELTSINRELSAKYHLLRKQINRAPTSTVYQTSSHGDASKTSISRLTS